MKRTFVSLMFVVLALTLAVSPAWSSGWFVGGGFENVSLGDDLTGIDDGSGFTFSFGYRYSPTITLDFLWGASVHEEQVAGGDVAYGRFLFGGKFTFLDPSTVQPFLTLGLASHAISFDFFDDITGAGLYFGGGADFYFDANNRISVGYRTTQWDGEDSFLDYDCETDILSVVYNYQFIN